MRRATADDADLLAGLLVAFNTEFDSPVEPVDVLSGRFVRLLGDAAFLCWVVGEGDGFALVTLRPAIWFDGPVGVLDELYVVPDRRSGGLGTELLRAVRAGLRELGCPELHINVDEVDAGARRFYERHGFVNVESPENGRMLCYTGPT